MALNTREKLFVRYYLGKDLGNATGAARRAGFRNPNKVAHLLLVKHGIREAVEAKLSEAAMEADEVLARLSRQASADMGDFLANPSKTDPDEVLQFDFVKAKRRDQLGNIKTIKRTRRTIPVRDGPPEVEVKVELQVFDPRPALETLAKFHGLTYEPEPEDLANKSVEELEKLARDKGRRRT